MGLREPGVCACRALVATRGTPLSGRHSRNGPAFKRRFPASGSLPAFCFAERETAAGLGSPDMGPALPRGLDRRAGTLFGLGPVLCLSPGNLSRRSGAERGAPIVAGSSRVGRLSYSPGPGVQSLRLLTGCRGTSRCADFSEPSISRWTRAPERVGTGLLGLAVRCGIPCQALLRPLSAAEGGHNTKGGGRPVPAKQLHDRESGCIVAQNTKKEAAIRVPQVPILLIVRVPRHLAPGTRHPAP